MVSVWICQLCLALAVQPSADQPEAEGATSSAEAEDGAAAPDSSQAAEDDAGEQPATAAEPAAPAATTWADRVTLGGLVDGYVAVPTQGEPRDPSRFRVFDAGNGSFLLAYAELSAAVAADHGGLRLDLGFGPVADLSSLEVSGDPPVAGSSEVFKHVQQGYATFKHGIVTADLGKFVTNAGAEVIEAKDNWIYSRSFLFGYAVPFSHTGLRVTAALSDQVSIQGSVVNGWDVVVDNNDDKTFGGSLFFTNAPSNTTAILNAYVGVEVEDVRALFDAVLVQKVGERLSFNLNATYGLEGDFSWWGVAGIGRLAATDRLSISLRAEHFQDPDGARTGVADNALSEATATLGLAAGGNAELRLEGRIDLANEEVFGADQDSKTQGTALLAGLAWF